MGEESEGLEHPLAASHYAPLLGTGNIVKWLDLIAPLLRGTLQHALILRAVKCAGTIYQHSSRPQGLEGIIQNLPLSLGTHRYILVAPLLDSLLRLAEHTLARAGRIDRHRIEPPLKSRKARGVVAGDDHIGQAPLAGVIGQDGCATAIDLVGYDQSLAADQRSIVGTLTSRSGTHVEDASSAALR